MKKEHLTPRFIKLSSQIDPASGCWNWLGYIQSSGYGQKRIGGRMMLMHRASWEAHNGPIPAGVLVLHRCDNRKCISPSHLFLGSYQDNTNDAQKKGRLHIQKTDFSFTRTNRRRKLSDEDVDYIRKSPWDLAWLAKKFSVSKSCISLVRNKKRKKLI